jgi:hypothetical protein
LASQQLACKRKLRLEIGFLHDKRDQVLACDSDMFLENPNTVGSKI